MSASRRPGPTTRITVDEVVDGAPRRRPDTLVTEEPLEVRLEWPGHPALRVAVVMRTPGADFELAAGFLMADGVIARGVAPRSVAYCLDRDLAAEQLYNVVTVTLDRPPLRHPTARSTSVSSACGVCGAESLDEVFTPDEPPIPVDGHIDAATITRLPDALLATQALFDKTGAIHAAGVFGFDGTLLVAREDIGRHNAVDKALGARLLGTASYGEDCVLCVSGRLGFDILSKAVVGRLAVVVAVGGPSSLAVALAERAGITVCGFSRGTRFVCYTHPTRLQGLT